MSASRIGSLRSAFRSLVLSDVDQAWAAYESAQRLAERYNTHYLKELGTILNNLEFRYRHGSYTLLDYLNALHGNSKKVV